MKRSLASFEFKVGVSLREKKDTISFIGKYFLFRHVISTHHPAKVKLHGREEALDSYCGPSRKRAKASMLP